MSLTPEQLASTWTWFGTGVSTIVTKKVIQEAAVAAVKIAAKAA